MSQRILLVEDNAKLAEGIEYNLRLEGYDVRIAETGRAALEIFQGWSPELLVLDLMLPDIDGYQVLKNIRGRGSQAPVIILSARSEASYKVRGSRPDADTYETQPFAT